MIASERGFNLETPEATVYIYLTMNRKTVKELNPDLPIDRNILFKTHDLVMQSRWFKNHAASSLVKIMVKLIQDLFQLLTPWMIDLLAHYCIMNNHHGGPLPVCEAYKYVWRLSSATPGFFVTITQTLTHFQEVFTHLGRGFLLAGKHRDQGSNVPVHSALTFEEQDHLCRTAQTLVRILCREESYKMAFGP